MIVLATGASVNLVLEPIFSSAVWGAGWYNAAETSHYADAALRYEGSVDIELQLGAGGAFWEYLSRFIVASRAYPRSMDISPDGAHLYKYRTTGAYGANYDTKGVWCTNANFSTSEGSFVTTSLGVVAIFREDTDPQGGTNYSSFSYINNKTGVIGSSCALLSSTNPLNPGGKNVDPIPFWQTNAQIGHGTYPGAFGAISGLLPQAGLETVEWSIDITENHHILYTCSGSRLPRAVLMGPMSVGGNVTLYNANGVFDPILGPANTGTITTPYMYAENTWFQVAINTGTPGTDVFIEMPAAVVESDTYNIQSADSITNRSFSLKGLGGRCDGNEVLPPCIISDYDGLLPTVPPV